VGLARLSRLAADPAVLRELVDLVLRHPSAMFETKQSAGELRRSLTAEEAEVVPIGVGLEDADLLLEQIAQQLVQTGGSR